MAELNRRYADFIQRAAIVSEMMDVLVIREEFIFGFRAGRFAYEVVSAFKSEVFESVW